MEKGYPMKIKAIITGATGMVGKGVLLECLESDDVASVLVVNRKPVEIDHPKLTEIIHQDFFDLSSIEDDLKGHNTCFFCLGVSSAGMSEDQYHRLTYDLTIYAAEMLLRINPDMVFCYVSGHGTDSTEKGKSMWGRVKGKTENALLALPFKAVYMFRPAFIQPMKGVRSSTKLYNVLYAFFKPLYPVLKILTPGHVTTTSTVGQAMIKVAVSGFDRHHLTSDDINALG